MQIRVEAYWKWAHCSSEQDVFGDIEESKLARQLWAAVSAPLSSGPDSLPGDDDLVEIPFEEWGSAELLLK